MLKTNFHSSMRFGSVLYQCSTWGLKSGALRRPNVYLSPTQFTRPMSSIVEKFAESQAKLKSVSDQGNDVKLKLYGLYKQATVGKNTTKKPGVMDFVGKAKWDAWTAAGDISQEEAQKQYISVIEGLLKESGSAGADSAPKSAAGPGLTVEVKDGIRTIKLNRPEKRNAITAEMYDAMRESLTEANTDSATKVVVLTGTGEYFCSGNDLASFNITTDIKTAADAACERLRACIVSYIDCQKPLIILVNGPAVGIGVTIFGLADIVYASESAHFTTPFSSLGLSPEACSSYTFPKIMGYAKANELLLFKTKITARQAEATGLVSEVFLDNTFAAETAKRVQAMAGLPLKSLVYSKELIRGRERKLLHEVNVSECDRLNERCLSEDCLNAVTKFLSGRK